MEINTACGLTSADHRGTMSFLARDILFLLKLPLHDQLILHSPGNELSLRLSPMAVLRPLHPQLVGLADYLELKAAELCIVWLVF